MTKTAVFLYATIIVLLFACKKSDSVPQPAPKSQWTFDGVSIKAKASYVAFGENKLVAYDSTDRYGFGYGNFITIQFAKTDKPVTSSILKIPDWQVNRPMETTECMIYVGNTSDHSRPWGYISCNGDEPVTLTVSSDGKLTASFSNITVSSDGRNTTKKVSGTLIEE